MRVRIALESHEMIVILSGVRSAESKDLKDEFSHKTNVCIRSSRIHTFTIPDQ